MLCHCCDLSVLLCADFATLAGKPTHFFTFLPVLDDEFKHSVTYVTCFLCSACLLCRLCQTYQQAQPHFFTIPTDILGCCLTCLLCSPAICPADFATLIGKPTHFFTIPYGSYDIDFMAGGLVVACCTLLVFTTAGGSWFNICE